VSFTYGYANSIYNEVGNLPEVYCGHSEGGDKIKLIAFELQRSASQWFSDFICIDV